MKLGLSQLFDPRLIPLVASTREFYAKRGMRRGPNSWNELQSMRDAAKPPAPSSPPALVEMVGRGDRTVPVRIHLPTSTTPRGVFLDIHGGGFYMGSAAGSDVRNRELADTLGIVVVSVDYRLAPEVRGRRRPTTARLQHCGSQKTRRADSERVASPSAGSPRAPPWR